MKLLLLFAVVALVAVVSVPPLLASPAGSGSDCTTGTCCDGCPDGCCPDCPDCCPDCCDACPTVCCPNLDEASSKRS